MTVGEATAKRIIGLCEQYKITPNKLSTISGITQSTINNIINTGSKNPTVSTIKKICDGLEITLAEFFDDELFASLEQEVR
ncbi:MAG: helix-turn-helix transcriptional regulator [Clostridiales bacterium]|nr:helix-turn-helix transcriptional regulator [Clostridiales bacterium]